MKTGSIHERLLDSTFEKAEEESKITITFDCEMDDTDEKGVAQFTLRDVNGFSDHKNYFQHITSLFTEIRQQTIRDVAKLPATEKYDFLQSANARLQTLCSTIRLEPVYQSSGIVQDVCVFNQPKFRGSREGKLSMSNPGILSGKATNYAQAWGFAIEETLSQFSSILVFHECYMSGMAEKATAPIIRKLPLRISVAQLACFMRAFRENGVLGIDNKSEICRITAAICQTHHQEIISADSIRNHFNYPESSTITFCISEFRRAIANRQALENQLRRAS